MKRLMMIVAAGLALGVSAPGMALAGPFLMVDFNNRFSSSIPDPTQPGFTGITSVLSNLVTSEGALTLTLSGTDGFSGAFGERAGVTNSGAFTFGQLYQDFAAQNNFNPLLATTTTPIRLTLTGTAIVPNASYQIKLYDFDFINDPSLGSTVTNAFGASPGSTTTGSTGQLTYNANALPTSNGQYSFTGVWSTTTNSLDLDISFVSDDYPLFNLVRLNGFEITRLDPAGPPTDPAPTAVPEPGSMILLGTGLLAAAARYQLGKRK